MLAVISIWVIVEARNLDKVIHGELIEHQALRPKGGTLYNIKTNVGQENEDPGEEWPERKEENQERVVPRQFSWLKTACTKEGAIQES